jgi:hypothetical protein
MSLKITIVKGPGAGAVHEFPATVEHVEIGRDPAHCAVVFPADATAIGRRHLVIQRLAGRYKLEVNLRNPVLLDGRTPFDGEELGPSQEIDLGHGAAVLRVETIFDSALPATLPGRVAEQPSQIAARLGGRARLLAAALGLVLLGTAASGGYLWFQQRETQRAVSAALTEGSRREAQTVSADHLRRAAQSTYLVMLVRADGEEVPFGTAWSVGQGALATNAHVAETFDQRTPGQRIVVRGTTPPYEPIEIERITLHPDYARFQTMWERTTPMRAAGVGVTAVSPPGAGYDVALMHPVAGARLAPPLTIAADRSLAGLGAGAAIAFVGFPMERLAAGGVNPRAPVPQTQIGHVTAATDYFLLPSTDAERHLVQHSLPATGGASGSPVIDVRGEVIAVLSGINVVMLNPETRTPSAAGVNFAQRADLVRELMDGSAERRSAARDAIWQEGIASFGDPMQKIPQAILAMWRQQLGADAPPPERVFTEAGALTDKPEPGFVAKLFPGNIATPGRYLVTAVSRTRQNLILLVTRRGSVVARSDDRQWFPFLARDVGAGESLDVIIGAPDRNERVEYELTIWRVPPRAAAMR